MNEDWKKSWFPFSVHTFPRELSYLLSTFWSPSWFSQSDINSTPSCEDYEKWLWGRYLTKSSVSVASFLFFFETCLTSDNYEFFPFLSFYVCIFFYMHIVLKVRNSSESKALAHSHLISRQSTLAQKDSFTNLLAQRACVPCMSTNVFFKEMRRA